jgi:hypothetical protein
MSRTGNNSRFIIHLLSRNGVAEHDELEPLPREDENDDTSHLIVQSPTHYQGTAQQIIKFVNSRINPLEVEPRMYLRSSLTTAERDEEPEETAPVIELVVTTCYRDDVRILVNNGEDTTLFLTIIAHLNVETLFLYRESTPEQLTAHLGKALSNHATVKRLWLKTGSEASDDSNFSVAASIIQFELSTIQELIVEGYGGEADVLSKHQQDLFGALEHTSSVQAVAFVKTTLLDTATMSRLGQALCVNKSISKLYLGSLDNAQEPGLLEFARCIPKMKHLRVLDVRLVHRLVFTRPDHRPGRAQNVSFERIIHGLQENCSLTKIQGSRRYTKDLSPSLQHLMDYQLQLNRSCAKQFVRRPTTLPNVWSFVLNKCNDNPSAMYYCLREKVVSACT